MRMRRRDLGLFHPRDLFTAGEKGAVWDTTETARIFSDLAGTIPITTIGGVVGFVTDLSPNGNHFVAPTTAARPTYSIDTPGAAAPFLNFNGTSQYLLTASPLVAGGAPGNCKWTAVIGGYASTSAAVVAVGSANAGSASPLMTFMGGTTSQVLTSNIRNDSSASPTGTPSISAFWQNVKKVVTTQFNGPSSTWRARDAANRPAGGGSGSGYTSNTAGTLTGTVTLTRGSMGCQALPTIANYWPGRVYSGCVINRFCTDAEVTQLENWVAARMAIVLP